MLLFAFLKYIFWYFKVVSSKINSLGLPLWSAFLLSILCFWNIMLLLYFSFRGLNVTWRPFQSISTITCRIACCLPNSSLHARGPCYSKCPVMPHLSQCLLHAQVHVHICVNCVPKCFPVSIAWQSVLQFSLHAQMFPGVSCMPKCYPLPAVWPSSPSNAQVLPSIYSRPNWISVLFHVQIVPTVFCMPECFKYAWHAQVIVNVQFDKMSTSWRMFKILMSIF